MENAIVAEPVIIVFHPMIIVAHPVIKVEDPMIILEEPILIEMCIPIDAGTEADQSDKRFDDDIECTNISEETF